MESGGRERCDEEQTHRAGWLPRVHPSMISGRLRRRGISYQL